MSTKTEEEVEEDPKKCIYIYIYLRGHGQCLPQREHSLAKGQVPLSGIGHVQKGMEVAKSNRHLKKATVTVPTVQPQTSRIRAICGTPGSSCLE